MVLKKIEIGVLFSQSGHMAVTEQAHIQGVLLACEEINKDEESGTPQLLEPIILSPSGDDRKYAEMATKLLVEHNVSAIFGCCLSTSRKAVVPLIERFNGILFYPSVYEGFEYSPNVIYGGAVPNQMILPLLSYVYRKHGKRIALIGSDTLYAREINRIVSEFLVESKGLVVSETYLPIGADSKKIKAVLTRADDDGIDAVFSSVVGNDSITLYNAHAKTKLAEKRIPIASLTTTESELAKIEPSARAGHISVSPYFGTLRSAQNKNFVKKFQERYGKDKMPGVYSEVGYSLVHFFTNAVRLSQECDTENILGALSGSVFKAPGGDLSIDVDTNHFTLRPHIGISRSDGSFEIVWDSPNVVRPDPYLVSYDRLINGGLAYER